LGKWRRAKANNYLTPIGRITNSYARGGNVSAGFGYYPGRGFFSANYHFDKRRYGIPFDPTNPDAEAVYLTPRRHSIQFNGGFRELKSFIENAKFPFSTPTTHTQRLMRKPTPSTPLFNKSTIFRGTFDQQKRGRDG